MARYNTIYAGPVSENLPQVRELPADVAILPGCAIVATAGEFALGTATTVGKIFVAQDNYITLKGVDNAYAVGERVLGLEMLDEQLYNVRIPTGVNVPFGAALTVGASGKWALQTSTRPTYAYAEEAYNNTSGSDQLIRVRAANKG